MTACPFTPLLNCNLSSSSADSKEQTGNRLDHQYIGSMCAHTLPVSLSANLLLYTRGLCWKCIPHCAWWCR